ncbi:MAG: hypothetical protein OSJ43_06420 [Oscillospiraceae bacterium]|nr:hypothetical protein [Oscillospiraceae bacterium]
MSRQPKQPVSINGVEFDALIDQSISYSAQVPEYPTEKGFNVNDTIILQNDDLSMTLYVTDTPVTWKNRFGGGFGRVEQVVKQLENLYLARQPVTIVTSDAVYTEMAIVSYTISKSSDTGYAREIPISFQKIIRTESKTVSIPDSYGKSGATGAPAGDANTTSASTSSGSGSSSSSSSEQGGSILYNAGKSVGLL